MLTGVFIIWEMRQGKRALLPMKLMTHRTQVGACLASVSITWFFSRTVLFKSHVDAAVCVFRHWNGKCSLCTVDRLLLTLIIQYFLVCIFRFLRIRVIA